MQERSATTKWSSLHNPTTPSDAKCNAYKMNHNHNTENQRQEDVLSAHTATELTASKEEENFRYLFVTSGWTSPTNRQANAQKTKSVKVSADTPWLAPKPLTMLVESGASDHHFDYELHSDPKDKQLNSKTLEKPHNTLTAGRHVLPGTATGTTSRNIIDTDGDKHPV